MRWRDLLEEVRQVYDGTLIWAMPYGPLVESPPPFLDSVDQVYLLWSAALSDDAEVGVKALQARAASLLDTEVGPFHAQLEKPLILGVSYPSADGALTGCLPDPQAIVVEACLPFDLLSRPSADVSSIRVDLEEQALGYRALLLAVNERDWISGFISRGYYLPADLQDKSVSIHGKPAEALLREWYPRLLSAPTP
jgi:hypothetical protein